MKSSLTLLALALWLTFSRSANARADTLRLATYNVENYNEANRMVEGVYREKHPKPEAEKTALRAMIKALDADVIALQEMGTAPFLAELQRDLRGEGCDYPYAEVLDAVDTERHVAVLSRRKFTAVRKHTDLAHIYFGERSGVLRGLLEVRLKLGDEEISIGVVHLKSRYTDRKDDPESALRRSGEAVAVRDRLLELFPDPAKTKFFLVGDCNDTTASRPIRALAQRGNLTLLTPLRATDSRGETWTHRYVKEDIYSRVDYIFASPAALPLARGKTATIFDQPLALQASDHRPVLVVLSTE